MTTFINPPEVKIPKTMQATPESSWFQSQATVLYQLWDAVRKLGTSNSSIISDTDVTESFIVACSDETSALTVGPSKATIRIPYDFEISDIRASVTTAPTGTTLLTVDIGEGGTSILSTPLTFDSGEKTTTTAATQRVIADDTLANDAEIRIDITAIGNTIAGAGLKVTIVGKRTG